MSESLYTQDETQPDETLDYEVVGPHWLYAANACAGVVLAGLALAGASVLALPAGLLLASGVFAGGLGIAFLGVVYGILVRRNTEYRFTKDVLMVRTGIISQNADAIRIAFVIDADVFRSLAERIVGVGTLRLKLLDRGERIIQVPCVFNPYEVQGEILRRAMKFRSIALQGDGGYHNGGNY